MRVFGSVRTGDISMMPPLGCLLSEATASRAIFTDKERDAESG